MRIPVGIDWLPCERGLDEAALCQDTLRGGAQGVTSGKSASGPLSVHEVRKATLGGLPTELLSTCDTEVRGTTRCEQVTGRGDIARLVLRKDNVRSFDHGRLSLLAQFAFNLFGGKPPPDIGEVAL